MESFLAENYMALRHIHMGAAVLSLLGFCIRGVWMMRDSQMLQATPVKILPHVIDTILLLGAIGLVIATKQYPFSVDWVTLKLFLLVAYIVIGTVALKRGKTKTIKVVAFIISIAIMLSIFAVAGIKPTF